MKLATADDSLSSRNVWERLGFLIGVLARFQGWRLWERVRRRVPLRLNIEEKTISRSTDRAPMAGGCSGEPDLQRPVEALCDQEEMGQSGEHHTRVETHGRPPRFRISLIIYS
ncbi:uncharacterized protein LOC143355730 [Halictus rubicundus]|uniref:uncharacterized protein LOC143355730 n=1 Tax=Halictus rubicundus TaxID=77578 RepID=UPI0040358185